MCSKDEARRLIPYRIIRSIHDLSTPLHLHHPPFMSLSSSSPPARPSSPVSVPHRNDATLPASPTVPVDSIIGNYDVLLQSQPYIRDDAACTNLPDTLVLSLYDPPSSSSSSSSLSSSHVGNNRFRVLLNLYQSECEPTRGEEHVQAVVQKLIHVVTTQCQPQGRFWVISATTTEVAATITPSVSTATTPSLETVSPPAAVPTISTEPLWTELDPLSVQQFVRDSLLASDSVRPVGIAAVPSPKATSGSPLFHINHNNEDDNDDDDDNTKKRGRRPSLLRRSVSETMTPALDSKKKSTRTDARRSFRKSPAVSAEYDHHDNGAEHDHVHDHDADTTRRLPSAAPLHRRCRSAGPVTPTTHVVRMRRRPLVRVRNPLDVVFVTDGTSLVTNHTGNNRIRVLVDIKRTMYNNSTERERSKMVTDLIQVVTTHWRGRFLQQYVGDIDNQDANRQSPESEYEVLDPHDAQVLLRALMESSNINSNRQGLWAGPRSSSLDDDASSVTTNRSTVTSSTIATTATAAEKRVSEVKQEAVAAIHLLSPPAPDLHIQSMRNAAVESLQKRKKRQGLANRIRHLSAANIRGESVGTVDRSTSSASSVGSSNVSVTSHSRSTQSAMATHDSAKPDRMPVSSMGPASASTHSVPMFADDQLLMTLESRLWAEGLRPEDLEPDPIAATTDVRRPSSTYEPANRNSSVLSNLSEGMVEMLMASLNEGGSYESDESDPSDQRSSTAYNSGPGQASQRPSSTFRSVDWEPRLPQTSSIGNGAHNAGKASQRPPFVDSNESGIAPLRPSFVVSGGDDGGLLPLGNPGEDDNRFSGDGIESILSSLEVTSTPGRRRSSILEVHQEVDDEDDGEYE